MNTKPNTTLCLKLHIFVRKWRKWGEMKDLDVQYASKCYKRQTIRLLQSSVVDYVHFPHL